MNFILAMLAVLFIVFLLLSGIYFAFPHLFKSYYVERNFYYHGSRLVVKVLIWKHGHIVYSQDYDFQGVSFEEAMKKVDEDTEKKLIFIKTLP